MSTQLRRAGRHVVLGALLWVGACGLCPAPASSAEPNVPSASEQMERAQRAYTRGLELRDREEYAAAAHEFQESVTLRESTSALDSLAECLQRLHRYAGAWHAARRLLVVAAPRVAALEASSLPDDEQRLRRERGRIARAERLIAAFESRLPGSHIVLEWPAGNVRAFGEVSLDGVRVAGLSPDGRIPVDPGEHELHVERKDAPAWKTRLSVGAQSRDVVLQVPGERDAAPDLMRTPHWRGPLIWIPAAATLALGGAWLWASLEHGSRLDEFREVNASGTDPERAGRLREHTQAMRAPVLVLGAATGIGLVTTAALYLLTSDGDDPIEPRRQPASASPWLSASGFGLSLDATF